MDKRQTYFAYNIIPRIFVSVFSKLVHMKNNAFLVCTLCKKVEKSSKYNPPARTMCQTFSNSLYMQPSMRILRQVRTDDFSANCKCDFLFWTM